jgi:hypothetical protein
MKKIFSVALATIGGVALTACSGGGCGCGPKGNPVYERPCCAQSGGSYGGSSYGGARCGGTAAPRGTYVQPAPAPMYTQPAPAPAMPRPSGGQMACGAGKCG